MPLSWLEGIIKRSVEKDYQFYDPPHIIWRKINRDVWEYKRRTDYHLRDLALMSILYLSTSRVSEIVRSNVIGGAKGSITKDQFVSINDFIMLRSVIIVKRRAETLKDYPTRIEIPFPTKGGLAVFTDPIIKYLDTLEEEEELFKFKTKRAFQIVNHITGEFPHYLRDMGLKLWLRIFDQDLVRLQTFSGHRRLENLAKYLRTSWRDSIPKILSIQLEEDEL